MVNPASESFAARWRSLLFISVIVLLVTLFRPYKSHPAIYSDGIGYHLWTRAFVQGDLTFQRYAHHPDCYTFMHPTGMSRGVYLNKYPPGLALLRLPVMALLVNRDNDDPLISPAEHWASQIIAALALLGICWFCLHMCQLLSIDSTASHLALITTIFGTALFHYGTNEGCMSHIYSAFFGTLLVWLGVRSLMRGLPTIPLLLTAFSYLILILIRNTNVLMVGGLTLTYLAGRRATGTWRWPTIIRDLAVILGGTAAGIALQLGYNFYAHGRLVVSSYPGEEFLWHRPRQFAVLFSYERGLFMYYPIVGLTLIAGLMVRRTRPWTACFAGIIAAYATLYGFWGCWTLGGSFGYRGLVDVLPAGAVLLAGALAKLSGRARTAVVVGAWICLFVTLELMVGAWTWHLSGEHHMGPLYWQHLIGDRSVFWFLYR